MKTWIKLRGWMRLYWWSLCPKCNSDAPELDHCSICNGLRSAQSQGYGWPWPRFVKDGIWGAFTYVLNGRPQDIHPSLKPPPRDPHR